MKMMLKLETRKCATEEMISHLTNRNTDLSVRLNVPKQEGMVIW